MEHRVPHFADTCRRYFTRSFGMRSNQLENQSESKNILKLVFNVLIFSLLQIFQVVEKREKKALHRISAKQGRWIAEDNPTGHGPYAIWIYWIYSAVQGPVGSCSEQG